MYVRAYLAIPCVSANDNVKHTKSNIRYDNKSINETNVKYVKIHVYEYTEWMFASNLSHRLGRKAEIHKQILNKTWRRWQAMAPHPIPIPCALTFPPSSHRDATTPSPCWAPHFINPERIMFSNPTPSKPSLSPAATMSDDTPSALTPPLHCASIWQPAVVAFESWTIFAPTCLSIVSPLLNHVNPIFESVCVFLPFSLWPLLF